MKIRTVKIAESEKVEAQGHNTGEVLLTLTDINGAAHALMTPQQAVRVAEHLLSAAVDISKQREAKLPRLVGITPPLTDRTLDRIQADLMVLFPDGGVPTQDKRRNAGG